MTSQKSTASAKAPQRQRGRERVASLLDAAAACFVDKGYEAATMTEIAARAGAAIGSLYQFFPTKEALAHALMTQYTQSLQQHLQQLAAQSGDWNDDQLGTQLIRLLVAFRRRHPAFAVLAESLASLPAVRGLAIRQHLREGLQELLGQRITHLSSSELHAAAVVVLQLMKAAVALSAEVGLVGRKSALEQLERALQLYLASLAKR
ncbi:TetR/AcrR family transcriptional regulator [Rhodanobacter sp. L36]|uniref:TetR/AcrR family transcriptional regulator n=1 Tax=Rhodanobacter sp. L36 TaxID=1747221 RepID=UPI00131CBE11|nr:TetR/AcrR family transcriptional regulator [Rhodanobacter sp. L36]